MNDEECLKFARLVEENMLTIWYDGRYRDGSPRWGAREIAFCEGDEKMEDPFMVTSSATFSDSPLAAVKACLSRRAPNPRKRKRKWTSKKS